MERLKGSGQGPMQSRRGGWGCLGSWKGFCIIFLFFSLAKIEWFLPTHPLCKLGRAGLGCWEESTLPSFMEGESYKGHGGVCVHEQTIQQKTLRVVVVCSFSPRWVSMLRLECADSVIAFAACHDSHNSLQAHWGWEEADWSRARTASGPSWLW